MSPRRTPRWWLRRSVGRGANSVSPGRVEGGAVAGLRNRRIARPGGRSFHREGAQGSPDVRRGGRTGRWSRSGPAGANPKHAQDRPASLGAVRVSSVRTAPRLEGSRAPTSSPYWLRSGMRRRRPLDGSASPSASMRRLRSAMEGLLRCGGLRSASLTSSFRRRVRLAGRLPCGPRASTGSDRRSRAARQASAASRRSAIPSRPEASARPRRTADSAGPEARRDDTRRRPGTVPSPQRAPTARLRRVLLDRDRPVVLPTQTARRSRPPSFASIPLLSCSTPWASPRITTSTAVASASRDFCALNSFSTLSMSSRISMVPCPGPSCTRRS